MSRQIDLGVTYVSGGPGYILPRLEIFQHLPVLRTQLTVISTCLHPSPCGIVSFVQYRFCLHPKPTCIQICCFSDCRKGPQKPRSLPSTIPIRKGGWYSTKTLVKLDHALKAIEFYLLDRKFCLLYLICWRWRYILRFTQLVIQDTRVRRWFYSP